MPTAETFAKLGLFIRQGFLDAASCTRIVTEMRESPSTPAVVVKDGDRAIESTVRRTLDVLVSQSTRESIEAALDALAPALGEHFGGPLVRAEDVHFLRCRPGDFFAPHSDTVSHRAGTSAVHARRVSVVLFLNAGAREPQPGEFSGGALRLFGLMKEPALAKMALPLQPETGLLVAFPSELIHAVEPVTTGDRLSIVTWLRSYVSSDTSRPAD
jgi:predicted 2-oxoglutarate/Fe(II)-dependent dioxygenase YbiX